MAKKKKSLIDQLVDVGVGTYETVRSPFQLLGTGLLAGGEALASGVDLDDREGIPFWNPEEASEGLSRGAQRYQWSPQTESGKASSDVVMAGLEAVDVPFQMFGEGVEGLTGSETAGDAAYWLTSLGLGGPIKGMTKAITSKLGKATIGDKTRIRRSGWYGKGPGSIAAMGKLPADMAFQGIVQGLNPVNLGRYQQLGISGQAWNTMNKNLAKAMDESLEAGVRSQARRDIVGDISNQYAQKVMYDPMHPAIQAGAPLHNAMKQIFPNSELVSPKNIANNPEVLSRITGMNIRPEVSSHILPHIENFPRIQETGKPVMLAHRAEHPSITGEQFRGAVFTGEKNPVHGLQRAWDNLMTNNVPITAKSLNEERIAINKTIHSENIIRMSEWEAKMAKADKIDAQRKAMEKPPLNDKGEIVKAQRAAKPKLESESPKPIAMQDGDGFISWSFEVRAGPDPLTGSITVRTVLDPKTGRMFNMSIDRLAFGSRNKLANKLVESGIKNSFISLTPRRSSFSDAVLKKHGLDDISLAREQAQGRKSLTTGKGEVSQHAKELRDKTLEEMDMALVTGKATRPPVSAGKTVGDAAATDAIDIMRMTQAPFKPNYMEPFLAGGIPTITSSGNLRKKQKEGLVYGDDGLWSKIGGLLAY